MTRTILAALALLASACATSGVRGEHVLTGPARPPFAGTVRIGMEGGPVPGGAAELGIVTASAVSFDATLPRTIAVLQAEAASIGANAVVRVRYDVGATGATATGVAVWLE